MEFVRTKKCAGLIGARKRKELRKAESRMKALLVRSACGQTSDRSNGLPADSPAAVSVRRRSNMGARRNGAEMTRGVCKGVLVRMSCGSLV